jgi:putative phosphoribosyl transferase
MVDLPFASRAEGGRELARALAKRAVPPHSVVAALARGGVVVGAEVADRLGIPLEVVVVRKIGVPWQPELAMGAIAGEDTVLDDRMIHAIGVSRQEVDEAIGRERLEMKRREELYPAQNPPIDLAGYTVFVVDDGLATGSTMLAAIRHVRHRNPARVVVAVPVGSKDACRYLRSEADEIVCLAAPTPFFGVGEWYRHFEQVTDDEVRRLLSEHRHDCLHAG